MFLESQQNNTNTIFELAKMRRKTKHFQTLSINIENVLNFELKNELYRLISLSLPNFRLKLGLSLVLKCCSLCYNFSKPISLLVKI